MKPPKYFVNICLTIILGLFGMTHFSCHQSAHSIFKKGFKKPGSRQKSESELSQSDGASNSQPNAPSPADPSESSSIKPLHQTLSQEELYSEVERIFTKHCISCHGPQAVQGNFVSLGSIDEIAKNTHLISPGFPGKSILFAKLAPQGNMPPGGGIASSEVQTIHDWIVSLKSLESINVPKIGDIVLALTEDFKGLDVLAQKSVRYFTLHQSGSYRESDEGFFLEKKQVDIVRKGLFKTLNSLAKSPEVLKPVAIDGNQLIYRVNLNDFGISTEVFDQIIRDYNPFQSAEPYWQAVAPEFAKLVSQTQPKIDPSHFLIRADWFVATATLPIPYELLLQQGIDHAALDKTLGIDRDGAIAGNKVLRAGLANSKVSTQNRVIERHQQANGHGYWLSYDFASVTQNIFENPLGPLNAFPSRQFEHDGGELIYQLPNGMLAFRLVNQAGQVIDKGPTSIVSHAEGQPEFGSAILNGISCMGCHSAGLIPVKDEVRAFAETNRESFTTPEMDKILQLYPVAESFGETMLADNQKYASALAKMGLEIQDTDPVNQTFHIYQTPLDRLKAAAELHTDVASLDRILLEKPFKSFWWSLRQQNKISREDFNQLVRQAWASIHGVDSILSPQVGDYFVSHSCMFKDPLHMDLCLLDKSPL